MAIATNPATSMTDAQRNAAPNDPVRLTRYPVRTVAMIPAPLLTKFAIPVTVPPTPRGATE